MPYIKEEDRYALRDYPEPENGGELNYMISMLISEFLETHGKNYANIAQVLGALEGAKFEFLRRVVGPYEDEKIQ